MEDRQKSVSLLKQGIETLQVDHQQNSENEKGLSENLRKLKEENDRLRRDKVEELDKN